MCIADLAIQWMNAGLRLLADAPPPQQPLPNPAFWTWVLFAYWVLGPLITGFWIWMLWHCYNNEPDRQFWFWVMLFIQPAAVIYFFTRFLSHSGSGLPKGLKRWSRGKEIEQLETAARQIGNAHQWVQLGDALRDVGRFPEAIEAYEKALAKEADNIQALFGAGVSYLEIQNYLAAKEHLKNGLEVKPEYKFGDLSLSYAKALCELNELEQAEIHLEQHTKRWRQPEALYLLATLALERDDPASARTHLEGLLWDIKGSPSSLARQHSRWKSRANKLLKQLPG